MGHWVSTQLVGPLYLYIYMHLYLLRKVWPEPVACPPPQNGSIVQLITPVCSHSARCTLYHTFHTLSHIPHFITHYTFRTFHTLSQILNCTFHTSHCSGSLQSLLIHLFTFHRYCSTHIVCVFCAFVSRIDCWLLERHGGRCSL